MKTIIKYIAAMACVGALAPAGMTSCTDMDGDGVEADPSEAFRWYSLSAAQGNPYAMTNLGNLYQTGTGTEKDLAEAVRWYEEAVEAGSATAMFLLAEMYEKGEYVGKDLKKARKLYLMASENGMPEAREEADRLIG